MYYVLFKNRLCLDYLNQVIVGAFTWKLTFVSLGAFKVGAVILLGQQVRKPQDSSSKDSQVHCKLPSCNLLGMGGGWALYDLNRKPT